MIRLSKHRKPEGKPKARFNARVFRVREKGYRTIGQICEATGIPETTFRRWEGNRLPPLPVVDGVKAIPNADFEEYVERCKAALCGDSAGRREELGRAEDGTHG